MVKQSPTQSETVRRIMDAARDVFSEYGFDGTTIDEIARRADINKAMLYYHIGNKETLYAEVIRNVIEKTLGDIVRDLQQIKDPVEMLKAYIRNVADAVDRNPRMPRIILREMASGGTHLPDTAVQAFARIFSVLGGILDKGKRTGIFIATSPFLLHMMVMGALVFYKTSATLRANNARLIKEPLGKDETCKAISGEVEKMILRSVIKAPRTDEHGGRANAGAFDHKRRATKQRS